MFNFIKKSTFLLILVLLISSVGRAAQTGWLNVFTDINGTKIYVDGRLVAQDQVVNYPLQIGDHYLKVELDGKKIYAKTFNIQANRTTTVVSDHFVDFKTNTPSRGAIDREAYRLRQVKGYAGFGIYGAAPAAGISFKWWMFDQIGLQLIGFANNDGTRIDEQFGGRLLIGFSDKVAFNYNLNAYMALGYARQYRLNDPLQRDSVGEVTSLSFGIEGNVGQVANALFFGNSYFFEDAGEGLMTLLTQVITLGLLNTTYVSLEIGLDTTNGHYLDDGSNLRKSGAHITGGIHYFF